MYDEIGRAGAILDEFCLRNLCGATVGWVFGVSVFSLKGEHIGWFEDGVLFDVDNTGLGFIPGARSLVLDLPAPGSTPALPVFAKRPCAPTLRGRTARPRCTGWSPSVLATYIEQRQVAAVCAGLLPRNMGAGHTGAGEQAR